MLCPCIHVRIYLRKSTIYIWYTRLLFYIDVINTQEHVHRLTREIITGNDLLFVDMQAHAHETRHFGSFPSFCIFSIFPHTIPFLWLSPMHLRTITIFVWQKKKILVSCKTSKHSNIGPRSEYIYVYKHSHWIL